MGSQQIGPDLELIIRDLTRRLRTLENAPRIPQLSVRSQSLQAERESLSNSGAATSVYPSFGTTSGSMTRPSVDVVVPRSRRLLCHFGVRITVQSGPTPGPTAIEGGYMAVKIAGGVYDPSFSDAAYLSVVDASSNASASVSNCAVIELPDTVEAGSTLTIETTFSHFNGLGVGSHSFQNPWLIVQPL